MQLPGGGAGLLAIRTPPSMSLALLYVAVLAVQGYGFFVAWTIWKRDRAASVLVAVGSAAIVVGAAIGFFVDFAGLRAPYLGAWPHAVFVLCMAVVLSREYSARAARIAATERQFVAAFEHAPIGKALLAPDGRFLRVNRALCRMFDSTAEELCARRLKDVLRPDDGASGDTEPQRLLAGDIDGYTVERRLLRRDGALVWALVAVSAVPDDRGRPLRFVAQLQDVTELRTHRDRLEELVATRTSELRVAKDHAERASRAKSEFLAHMSHEVRNPLNVMLGYAQLLQRDATLGETQRRRVDSVFSSGAHLLALLDDVLEMSRIEAGRPGLVEDPFDPWAALDDVERMFAAQAAAKGVELTIVRDPELPRSLFGDGAKMKQILINLTSNAIKFTPRGTIRIEASSSALADGSILARVVVADTGIGIAPEDRARMFQPFEQLEAGARAGGTGLGLAISLAYARLMGGDLTVESAPDVGSTFTFTFVTKRVSNQAA
jgi:PAS domain S-box-containing protein